MFYFDDGLGTTNGAWRIVLYVTTVSISIVFEEVF
jgi:hypothetical protein